MIGTAGIAIATEALRTPRAHAEPTATTRARRILIPMAVGQRFPITGKCGFLTWLRDGRLIVRVAGCGSPISVGRGFLMSRGAGLPITMAAGCPMARVGRGGRDRWRRIPLTIRFGRRRTFRFSDSEAALASESALDSDLASVMWAGCLAVLGTGFTRGTGAMAAAT